MTSSARKPHVHNERVAMDTTTAVELGRLTTICLAFGFGTLTIVMVVALLKAPESSTRVMIAMIDSGSVIHFGIVIIIVMAVITLRLVDKISAESSIATISGVAGYVLGGERSRRRSKAED
jgi:hypothetical protein